MRRLLALLVGGVAAAPPAAAIPDAPAPLAPLAGLWPDPLGLSTQSWLLSVLGFLAVLAGTWLLFSEARAARRRERELASDRTALTAAYTQAEAKNAQLQATLAGMSDGVMMLDAALSLVEWNDLFPEFTGVPREILRVGVPMQEMLRAQALGGEFGDVDADAEVQRRLQRVRDHSGTVVSERVRPNGQVLELRRTALPGGGLVTLYSDITARKQAEAAQRETRRRAEVAIEQRAQFVAMVSHEIRVLLNAVTSSFTLLDQSGLSEHQRGLAATGRQAGNELLELISDILDLARIDAGQLALRPTEFTVAELVEGVRELFGAAAMARGIRLEVSIAEELPARLYADVRRLRQILINFVGNACKYSRPGTVTLRAEPAEIDGRPTLRLLVRDQGPRIPEQQAALLFVPFARLDYARASGAPGTGLGLAICERLTRLMGGRIGLNAAPSAHDAVGGNEFWVAIPLQVPRETAIPEAADATPRFRRARRSNVLLVEDVESNRMLTAALLRRDGHRVDVAESGAEAVRLAEANPYDIVFMDLVMPGMTGYEATRRIRAMAGPAGTMPILALTASDNEDKPAELRDAGMDGLLAKPVHPEALSAVLASTLWPIPPRGAVVPAGTNARSLVDTDRLGELQRGLPPGMFSDLVEKCLGDIDARLLLLRQALAAGDSAAVVRAAHALAGMAGAYALSAIERRMRNVMRAGNVGDLAMVAVELADIEGELERSTALLRSLLQDRAA